MKKKLYTLSMLSTVFGCMSDVYATAQVQDDVEAPQPCGVAASAAPETFEAWTQLVASGAAPASSNMSMFQTDFRMIGALASALKTNTSITELDLRNCLIGDASAALLIEALQVNATLKALDVRQNPIGGYFLEKLLDLTHAHPTLKTVLYDGKFYENLSNMEGDDDRAHAHGVAARHMEDLLANRTSVVSSMEILADEELRMDGIMKDMSFPRLTKVELNLPMTLYKLEGFAILMGVSPVLKTFKLKSEEVSGMFDDNKKNKKVGYAFFDELKKNNTLTNVSVSVEHSEERVVFDKDDPMLVNHFRQTLRNHPSLVKLAIHAPDFKVRMMRTLGGGDMGQHAPSVALHMSSTEDADINGLAFVVQNRLARHLVLNFDQRFGEREMQRVNDVFAAFPFERVTLSATHAARVDIKALNTFMGCLKTNESDVVLDLALPTDMLPTAMKIVANRIPCVTQVNFQDHESLRATDFDTHLSRVEFRKPFLTRLFSALDDASSARIAPQRHIITH
ncbi:MAG: hypothetical protein LCH26_07220 [Proteobacteria bacterium]|nr:hypothetical protein [Pseudomonadota bacterium]